MHFPEVPDLFQVKNVSARYADLYWSPSPSDGPAFKAYQLEQQNHASTFFLPEQESPSVLKTVERKVLYQIVKLSANDGTEMMYEGKDFETRVLNLAPNTTYRFKIRVKFDKHNAEWSEKFIIVECVTKDETNILKAYERLIESVKMGATQTVIEILAKYKDDLNIDYTDSEGRTLSMVRSTYLIHRLHAGFLQVKC
jgi:hypothetical protein